VADHADRVSSLAQDARDIAAADAARTQAQRDRAAEDARIVAAKKEWSR
jgi:hypothetical protein